MAGSRTMDGRLDWMRCYNNAVIVLGIDMETLGAAAHVAGVYVSIGVTERDDTCATLYCTNLFFGQDGSLLGKHCKVKPTGTKRCIWGERAVH